MKAERKPPVYDDGRPFYRIVQAYGGLVDIWLTPGEAVPMFDSLTGRLDYNIRVMMVRGIDPNDPQYGGNLGEHIRRHYDAWIQSAEEYEI